jgi:transmembrane sensor
MEKYASYGYEDFVRDDDFVDWVLSPTEESDLFWHSILDKYAFQKENLKMARMAVVRLRDALEEAGNRETSIEIWSDIQNSMSRRSRKSTIIRRNWGVLGVAAALAMILISYAQDFWRSVEYKNTLVESVADGVIVLKNNHTMALHHDLPDNSVVLMEPGSEVRYTDGFSAEGRKVTLSGEAFFDVVPDEKRPFVVEAGDLRVRVLGTSFRVKEGNDNVLVAVKTGKVSVFRQKDSQENSAEDMAVLKPNEQVAYKRGGEGLEKTIVPDPMPVTEISNLPGFSFHNEAVSRIFSAIEQAYGIEIAYEKKVLANCRLTTSLGNETLFEQLNVICVAIGASYEVQGTRIIVNGRECL